MHKSPKRITRSDDYSVNRKWQKNQFNRKLRNLSKEDIAYAQRQLDEEKKRNEDLTNETE